MGIPDETNLPATHTSSTDVEVRGAETLGTKGRLIATMPLALMVIAGVPIWFISPLSMAVILAIASVATLPGLVALKRSGDVPMKPSECVQAGAGAFSAAMLVNALYWAAGRPLGSFPLFWFIWPVLTALAVRRASKTDIQSGWATGASSIAAFGLIRAISALYAHGPLVLAACLWAMAGGAVVGGLGSWVFLRSRGRGRSGAALGMLLAGAGASVSAALYCFMLGHPFIGLASLAVPLYTFLAPLVSNRDKIRAALGESSRPALSPPSAE
jgi:hypothetical protein